MDKELEKLKASFEADDDYMQERALRAKRLVMPPNPAEWLDKLEVILAGELHHLPHDVRPKFVELMESQIKSARRAIRLSPGELPMLIGLLHDNLVIIRSNIDLKTASETGRARSGGGKTTAEIKKASAQERIEEATNHWHSLSGKSERDRAAIISERMGAKVNTVRGWLRKAGLR